MELPLKNVCMGCRPCKITVEEVEFQFGAKKNDNSNWSFD